MVRLQLSQAITFDRQLYKRIRNYCQQNGLHILSNSYEFAINDYLSPETKAKYITKIVFYISEQDKRLSLSSSQRA